MEEQDTQAPEQDRVNAFVLRIAPGNVDKMQEALANDDLIIGWAEADGLLDTSLDWWKFRAILHKSYYSHKTSYRASGNAAGSMWRFIREMKPGDFVIAPHGSSFYIGKVAGEARYEASKVTEDSAYRRKVEWLNGKKPIARKLARAALISRMKVYQTCADALDLVPDIQDALSHAGNKSRPAFSTDLRARLVSETLKEIGAGRMDSFAFENLIASVLQSMGGTEVKRIPRKNDKGADVVATFSVAQTFDFKLAVQAKHFQPKPPVSPDVIDQLVTGMEAEGADIGWVVTSGTFSSEATAHCDDVMEQKGYRIELIDGEQLAELVVDRGLRSVDLVHV